MGRAKTNDEFIAELKEKNPTIIPLEEYKGATTKILVRCLICRYEWLVRPNDVLNGKGCAKCSGKYKMSHEEYEQELFIVNPNILLLGRFTGKNNRIKVQCKICGRLWNPFANNLLRGHGCKNCSISNRKTHEDFIDEVFEKNPYVDIVGKYINNETFIDVCCKNCGEIYPALPQNILNGNVHMQCSRIVKNINREHTRKTHEQFVAELNCFNPNILVIGKYVLYSEKIEVQCKICGHKWSAVAGSLLQGNGCPCCAKKRIQKSHLSTHEEFLAKLYKTNPHIKVLDTYVNNRTKIRIQCKNCGHIEYASPDKLLSRIYNCKACSDYTSFPNRFMTSVLDELHINYTPEKVFDWSNNKRYDFYLPDYNMIIEMHGEQHYKKDLYGTTVKQQEKNDKYKYDLACNNGISNYIVIDSRKSSFDYIWNNLLNEVFFNEKLSSIDKQTVLERCVSTSKIVELSKYYNSGITKNVDLQRCLGVSKGTVTSYMRKAIACNLIKVS